MVTGVHAVEVDEGVFTLFCFATIKMTLLCEGEERRTSTSPRLSDDQADLLSSVTQNDVLHVRSTADEQRALCA